MHPGASWKARETNALRRTGGFAATHGILDEVAIDGFQRFSPRPGLRQAASCAAAPVPGRRHVGVTFPTIEIRYNLFDRR